MAFTRMLSVTHNSIKRRLRLAIFFNRSISSSTKTPSKQKETVSEEPRFNYNEPPNHHLRDTIDQMVRVNHSGEYSAVRIYEGQLAVLRGTREHPILEHFLEQERNHLRGCEQSIRTYRARPSALIPLWDLAGFALGYTSAFLGKDAAMACTEAVESVIADHYNDQLRILHGEGFEEFRQLREQIRRNRDDEIEHLEKSQEEGAKNAVCYDILSSIIKLGCKAAIFTAKRI